MKIQVISVGTHLPSWVNEEFYRYAQRLPRELQMDLIEIPAQKRGKKIDLNRIMLEESRILWETVPKDTLIIPLDRSGTEWDSLTLSSKLQHFLFENRSLSFIIGGPEGIAPEFLKRASLVWSLSKLTLPHHLVRIVVAEQIFRAGSIMKQHPYHR